MGEPPCRSGSGVRPNPTWPCGVGPGRPCLGAGGPHGISDTCGSVRDGPGSLCEIFSGGAPQQQQVRCSPTGLYGALAAWSHRPIRGPGATSGFPSISGHFAPFAHGRPCASRALPLRLRGRPSKAVPSCCILADFDGDFRTRPLPWSSRRVWSRDRWRNHRARFAPGPRERLPTLSATQSSGRGRPLASSP